MDTNIRIRHEIFFRKLAERQQLAHAYLFSGNDEEQKQRIISDFLAHANIQFADQVHVRPQDKEISIGDIRRLNTSLRMSAWNSSYKIAVIHSADGMNTEAQSAFLKLLEEPKGNTVFFLVTEFPDLLLNTIRSRAQEFKFYTYNSFAAKEANEEFENLRKASIAVRFAAAKKLAENPEEMAQKLAVWLPIARGLLLDAVQKNSSDTFKLLHTIKTLQEVSYALQTSNINPRLALEELMLDI